MGSIKEYLSDFGSGLKSLITGLGVTGKEFVTPKITEFYPEDRDTYKWPERFRAILTLVYDKEGNHKCIACGTCERVCPNGTITLETKMVDTIDGKKKKKLDKYIYDLGTCTFCNLCVTNCPTDALAFSNDFEQAVFTREKLVKKLNYLPEKEEPAPSPEEIAKAQAERQAKIEAAMKAKAAREGAAPAAAPANAAANKALEAAKAAVAAAATPEDKAKAEERLAKIEAALKAKAAKDAAAAPAPSPAPVEDKAAAAANKAVEAAKAAVAAATTPEEKAKAEEKLAKIEAALKAKAARDAQK